MKKLQVRKRARKIKKIREKRIFNLNNDRLCLIFDSVKENFDFRKLKELHTGYKYNFSDDNYITIKRFYDESCGSSWRELYINNDNLKVNHNILNELYNFLENKYKNSKENRIEDFIKKID